MGKEEMKRGMGISLKFEVLLSCMHEKDLSLIEKSGLNDVNTLIINQCDTERDKIIKHGIHKMLNTATRGLSVSRNMAIANSDADICLLSDNDEVFVSELENKVVQAYEELKEADVIIFKVSNYPNRLGNKLKKLKKLDLLRICSWQISFKLASVKDKIFFDTNLGAGTGNGASEENKFLLDCYKMGLNIYYVPVEIGSLEQVESTWFKGFDEVFFFNRGKTTRYIFGVPFAVMYAVYYLFVKYRMYKKDVSVRKAIMAMIKGLATKDINMRYNKVEV